MLFSRKWAMPSANTFSIKPIAELLDHYCKSARLIVDPFARDSEIADVRNDLNPMSRAQYHLRHDEFLVLLKKKKMRADVVLLDPPYSPRQISECYQSIGLKVGTRDTQNARLYAEAKDGLNKILKPKGIAICCGWNSSGFGIKRGFELIEILMVAHGGAHNDTIITVEKKNG